MARRKAAEDAATAAEAPSDAGADAALLTLVERGLVVREGRRADGAPLWRISGNTIEHRTALREAGGQWNKLAQVWEFSPDDPTAKLAEALASAPSAPRTEGDNKPHYWGHRGRVREKVMANGAQGLADYELLELLLFYSIERIDTKPLAKKLVERFGSLGDVLAADDARLAEADLSQATVVHLKAIRETAARLLKREVVERPVIGSWKALLDYCHATMQHDKTERFRVLYLDRKNALIADEAQQKGTVDHTPVYPREVVKRALELGASSLILAHNHPSGDPTPSREDIETTREIADACKALGLSLHDHLVIGRKGHASFKSLGLL